MKPKRMTAFLLSVAMILSMLPTFSLTATAAANGKNITLGTSALKGGQKSNVYFGNYQQSSAGDTPPTGTENVDWIKSSKGQINGQGPYYNIDPIKWRVLSNGDGKLFLLSDRCLDIFQYNTVRVSVTWETCTMRSWLNGYDKTKNGQSIDYSRDNFIGSAFSSAEKNAIVKTSLKNENNGSISGGNTTNDQIFLLSIAEALNSAYGFNTDQYGDDARMSYKTAYICGGGKTGCSKYPSISVAAVWWLRSPGNSNQDCAAAIYPTGQIFKYGYPGYVEDTLVRPAFNLNLSSVLFTTPAENGKSAASGLQKTTKYTGQITS